MQIFNISISFISLHIRTNTNYRKIYATYAKTPFFSENRIKSSTVSTEIPTFTPLLFLICNSKKIRHLTYLLFDAFLSLMRSGIKLYSLFYLFQPYSCIFASA